MPRIKIEDAEGDSMMLGPLEERGEQVSEPSSSKRKREAMKKGEEDDKKNIKAEEKVLTLSQDSITLRMGPFDTTPRPINMQPVDIQYTVSRKDFLCPRYGGGSQTTYTSPSKGFLRTHAIPAKFAIKEFGYFTRKWNPHLPERPGLSGIAFSRGAHTPGPIPVFIQKRSGQWLYYGHYMVHRVNGLSTEEWAAQSEQVRQTWVGDYFGRNWHSDLKPTPNKVARKCAEYLLWKASDPENRRDPTSAEIDAELELDNWSQLNPGNLEEDLDSGIISIPVCILQCVEYREEFQRELIHGSQEPEGMRKKFPIDLYKRRKQEQTDGAQFIKKKKDDGDVKMEDVRPSKRRRGNRWNS